MTDQTEEFNKLVTRIEQHQSALGLNDSEFVARYQSYLGSHKTWVDRIQARNIEAIGNTFPKWLGKLRAMVSELDGGVSAEEFYEKLPITAYATDLYNKLQGQTNDRRCGMLLGIYGSGKTVALRSLNRSHPRVTAYVRANETWKESKMEIAVGFARVLGSGEGLSAARTFRGVIEHLKANPITVLIDEAHEGGVLLFKLIKTLIDETRAKFILASYPTAWIRLCNGASDAQAEAQQLLGRTYKPIRKDWFSGIRKEDVVAYLQASANLNGRAKDAATRILPILKSHGNLRVLADAVERARVIADVSGEDMTVDLLMQQIYELCPQHEGGGR